MITEPAQVRHVVDRAMRIAASERAITCIIVPNDVQLMPAISSPPRSHGSNFSSTAPATRHPVPSDTELHAAAHILNAGEKVAQIGRASCRAGEGSTGGAGRRRNQRPRPG